MDKSEPQQLEAWIEPEIVQISTKDSEALVAGPRSDGATGANYRAS